MSQQDPNQPPSPSGRSTYYILDPDTGEGVPCDDIVAWGEAFKREDRLLKTEYVSERGRVPYWGEPERELERADKTAVVLLPHLRVSTVFLGMDHNFSPDGPAIIWETMVFPTDGNTGAEMYSARGCTRADDLRNHELGVAFAQRWCEGEQ